MTSNAACYGFFAVVVVEILWTRANSRVVQIWFTGQTHGRQRSMFGMLLRVVVSIKQLKWTLWYCVDFNKLLQLYTFISLDFVIHIGWVLFYVGSNKKVSSNHSSNFEPLSSLFKICYFVSPTFHPRKPMKCQLPYRLALSKTLHFSTDFLQFDVQSTKLVAKQNLNNVCRKGFANFVFNFFGFS